MQPEANKPPPLPAAPPPAIVPEVLPPEPAMVVKETPNRDLPRWLSRRRLMLAFAIAVLSDVCSVWLEFIPPLQLASDLITAGVLFIILGWRWGLLFGLVLEAIPGIAIFPAWVLVVAAIAIWGSARPGLR
jgi:hypothetical protein